MTNNELKILSKEEEKWKKEHCVICPICQQIHLIPSKYKEMLKKIFIYA